MHTTTQTPASPHRPLERDTTRSDERPAGAKLTSESVGRRGDDDGHAVHVADSELTSADAARQGAAEFDDLGHGVQSCALGATRGALSTASRVDLSHGGTDAREGGPSFTATHAHRACLRALPSTFAGLGFGFAHIVPVLTDAGLVDCRNSVYACTPDGQAILDAHDAALEHAERSHALAGQGAWDKRLAVVRIAARANKLCEELKAIEADLHSLELRATGMESWRYRGAEVSAQHAQQLVWSVVCKLDGAGQ